MAGEKCGLLAGPRTVPVQRTVLSMSVLECGCHMTAIQLAAGHSCVMYSAWNPKDNYDMSASAFVVQFNGFMSLTS
jgi:hypothetical protein